MTAPQCSLEDRILLYDILKSYSVDFWIFGSRLPNGTPGQFSDLDLCYKGSLAPGILSEIQEKLENSNLPFKVDLVGFDQADENFQKILLASMRPLDLKGAGNLSKAKT